MIRTFALIACSVLLGVSGQVLLKMGVGQSGLSEKAAIGLFDIVVSVIKTPLMLLGFLLYGVASIVWVIVLSKVDLSFAYPFLAFNFILITISSRILLSETIPLFRWLGVLIICAGILVVAVSGRTG